MTETILAPAELPSAEEPKQSPAEQSPAEQRPVEQRKDQGKALRQACPRASHSTLGPDDPARDPLALIDESNHDRLKMLLPVRYTRMMESEFAFFRGTATVQAHDLRDTPTSGIQVQCCGDCHLMNFGGFATPERTMVFDINDFDETHEGPFEWDLKRLTASLVLAARWRSFSDDEAKAAARSAVAAYRTTMDELSTASLLETWYARITLDDVLKMTADDPALQKRLKKALKKARQNTSEHVFEKITKVVNGTPRIVTQPPLLFRSENYETNMKETVRPFFQGYRDTLTRDRQKLFDRYRIVDAAYKVVGVGSVGTRCFIALLMGMQDDPLFLQVKEARRSVLEKHVGRPSHAHDGERVVSGQRMMQASSDIFLGWARGPKGRTYYVRQLRDMKYTPDLSQHTPAILAAYGRLCGATLARAHARTGDAATISGYLGSNDTFDEALCEYSVAYAERVERDFKVFQTAVRAGRFPLETSPMPR